jgi:hypothetical protein
VKRLCDLGGFARRHAILGTMLVTIALVILAVTAGVFVLNSITAHRWTHNLPVALLTPSAAMIGLAATGAQLARDVIEKWLPAMASPRAPADRRRRRDPLVFTSACQCTTSVVHSDQALPMPSDQCEENHKSTPDPNSPRELADSQRCG